MTTTNLDVLAYSPSPIGAICLRRRELLASPGTIVTEITVDQHLLMSSHHTESERALSRLALQHHEGSEGLDVLVGGLGLGYTAKEALDSPAVAHVNTVEFLPQVLEWFRDGLVPLSEEMNADPRLELTQGDIYAMLAEPPERRYDLILIDVDHSPDEPLAEANATFYTEKGLEQAKQHLSPGGLLGVWSYADSSPFEKSLRAVFPRVGVEPVRFENELTDELETNWLFLAINL
jgi:spermidine synthase